MRKYLTLVPAYGRDYKSKKEVMADWNDGKDFRLEPHGSYINKTDYATMTDTVLNIRYKGLTQVCVIEPPKAKKA